MTKYIIMVDAKTYNEIAYMHNTRLVFYEEPENQYVYSFPVKDTDRWPFLKTIQAFLT